MSATSLFFSAKARLSCTAFMNDGDLVCGNVNEESFDTSNVLIEGEIVFTNCGLDIAVLSSRDKGTLRRRTARMGCICVVV